MSELNLLIQLKDNLIIFFDELIELLPEEPDLVIVRIFLKDKIPIMDVMEYIIEKLVPLKHLVIEKDDNFFMNHNILFEKLDENRVNHFKRLWTSGALDNENKGTVWRWFRSFIYLAEKYDNVSERKVARK
jgi:hypothetical protein